MLKQSRTICLIGAISIAFTIAGPVRASCTGAFVSFGQLTKACTGGTAYCYLRSPGLDTTASILGSFWSLGYGNPAPGLGNDNGSRSAGEHWLFGESSGIYLAGYWNDPGVDGCIAGEIPSGETSEIMAMELSDTDIFNQEGFFAAAAVARHPASNPEFDFSGGIQRDIVMAPIPLPKIGVATFSASSQPVYPQDVSPGFYSDGAVTQSQVIVGYRVYYQEGIPPPNRRRSAWTAFSPVVPLGQPYVRSDCFCCGGWPMIMTFAVSLVFADGFETDYLSRQKTIHACIPENSQDIDGDGDIPVEYGGGDCNDFDDTIYTNSPEINDGRDNQCPGAPGYGTIDEISGTSGFYHPGDKTKFTWHVQGGASNYELARSNEPDFAGSCTSTLTPLGTFADTENPSPGSVFYYLVRAAAPHFGSWGKNSAGAERTVACQ
jgi:hypothetical protein